MKISTAISLLIVGAMVFVCGAFGLVGWAVVTGKIQLPSIQLPPIVFGGPQAEAKPLVGQIRPTPVATAVISVTPGAETSLFGSMGTTPEAPPYKYFANIVAARDYFYSHAASGMSGSVNVAWVEATGVQSATQRLEYSSGIVKWLSGGSGEWDNSRLTEEATIRLLRMDGTTLDRVIKTMSVTVNSDLKVVEITSLVPRCVVWIGSPAGNVPGAGITAAPDSDISMVQKPNATVEALATLWGVYYDDNMLRQVAKHNAFVDAWGQIMTNDNSPENFANSLKTPSGFPGPIQGTSQSAYDVLSYALIGFAVSYNQDSMQVPPDHKFGVTLQPDLSGPLVWCQSGLPVMPPQ